MMETDSTLEPTGPDGETRRRRRSKRRHSRRTPVRVPRRRLVQALTGFALALAITAALPALRRTLAGSPWASAVRPEWVALGVAALAGVWLFPGVEDRVLEALGKRRKPRSHRRRSRRDFPRTSDTEPSVEGEEGA
ncbi:MAG: hypothetical protein ACKO5K_08790 [Armatimonadota bacterium]